MPINNDLRKLKATVHKTASSLGIIGTSVDIESIAKKKSGRGHIVEFSVRLN